MKTQEITTKHILKTYYKYIEEYKDCDQLPSVFTFLQALGIDTIYISNIINEVSKSKNTNKDKQEEYRQILNVINGCLINIKELIISKLINSNGKNALNIIKILDTHYNQLLSSYLGQNNNIKGVVVNVVARDNKNNVIKI